MPTTTQPTPLDLQPEPVASELTRHLQRRSDAALQARLDAVFNPLVEELEHCFNLGVVTTLNLPGNQPVHLPTVLLQMRDLCYRTQRDTQRNNLVGAFLNRVLEEAPPNHAAEFTSRANLDNHVARVIQRETKTPIEPAAITKPEPVSAAPTPVLEKPEPAWPGFKSDYRAPASDTLIWFPLKVDGLVCPRLTGQPVGTLFLLRNAQRLSRLCSLGARRRAGREYAAVYNSSVTLALGRFKTSHYMLLTPETESRYLKQCQAIRPLRHATPTPKHHAP